MKLYLKIAVALLTAAAACSDKPETTTLDQLESTSWAGTFRSKDIPVDQVFSIEFWSNDDFEWHDITQTRITGTWRTSGKEVLLTFPGEETLVATVVDNHWTLSTPSSNNNYSLQSVHKISYPTKTKVANTTWLGSTTNPDAPTLKLAFGTENSVTLDDTIQKTYELYGVGMLVHMTTGTHEDTYYLVFVENTALGVWKLGSNLYSISAERK